MADDIAIHYTDANYESLRVFGVQGAYTDQQVTTEHLPKGFYYYSMLSDPTEKAVFSGILAGNAGSRCCGMFFAKQDLGLKKGKKRLLSPEDWSFEAPESFSFEKFFGVKQSFDFIVSQANKKHQEQMIMGKTKTKQKSQAEELEPDF